MKFHDITRNYLGDFGRYQVLVFLILLGVRAPSVIHNMGFVFFAATPDHWCVHPRENPNLNLTDEEWMIYSIPATVKEGKKTYSSCKVYSWVGDGNMTSQQITARLEQLQNGTTFPKDYQRSCKRREFNTWTTVKNSLTTELDLVCDRKWMKSLIASIYAAGWIVGGPIAGYMADRFGRRVVLRVTCIMTVLLGFANPFASTYIPFLVVRFFLSAFLNAALAIAFTVCIELVGPRWRSMTANLYMLVWAVGYMALAGIAYLVREKMKFMLISVAPSAILLILVWFIPESVPWLVANGRKDAADKIIERIAKINKKKLPAGVEVTVETGDKKSKGSVLDLVRAPNLRKVSFILIINWFVDALVFYMISWNSTDLHGNLYLNVFLAGFIEIPAYILNMFAVQYLGRRLSMSSFTILSGIALLLVMAVPGKGTALVALTITSKFFITMAFTTAYQWTTELYPTMLRATGLVVCNTCARVGTFVAPLLPALESVFKEFPLLLCGALAVFGGCLLLLLPETLHQTLPTSVEEAEEFGRKNKLRNLFKLPKKPSYKEQVYPTEAMVPMATYNEKENHC